MNDVTRHFMNQLWAGCLFSMIVLLASLSLQADQGEGKANGGGRPNIVYILVDDLGYGDLGCYGQQKFGTPNIDRLAQSGMKFTQHYSGSTVCAPSRCSLMTGLHTGHAQVRGNREVKPEGQAPMADGTVTIPALLKQAGYVSGMFGKWGLGAPGSTSDPANFFDEVYGYNCQREAHDFYPDHLWHNREKVPLDGKTYSHDLIMDHALKFIRTNKDQPFFCYMPITIPHAAMQAPKHLRDKYRKMYPQFADKIGRYANKEVENPVAAFPAMMEHLDYGVGQVLDLLEELGIEGETLVFFTSDNGPHREGGHDPDFWNCNGPLRGIKRDLYEGGIRVPLLVSWPGKIEAGVMSDHISAFWDMLPTFCEVAGVTTPNGLDGISMMPGFLGQSQPQHDYLYWEFFRRGGSQAIRLGNFKGIRKNVSKNPNAPLELYDLSVDLSESQDVAAEHPKVVQNMKKHLANAHVESAEFPLIKADDKKKKKTNSSE